METTRIIKDKLFSGFVIGCGLLMLGLLFLGLFLILKKGLSSVSLDFILTPMSEGGISGGVYYQILGTFILLGATLFIVLPISFATALLRSVYLKKSSAQKALTLFLYVSNGIPSIIFGLFGFFFFVKFLGWGKSWLTGGFLLAFMILPTVALTLSEGINRVSDEYIENARALGLGTTHIILSVLIPQSFSSFMSGLLLGLARAVGETAPILFTATIFAGATIPKGVVDSPVLSLPYHIFTLTQESYHAQALNNAWASACILIGVVFLLSFLALPFRIKAYEEAKNS